MQLHTGNKFSLLSIYNTHTCWFLFASHHSRLNFNDLNKERVKKIFIVYLLHISHNSFAEENKVKLKSAFLNIFDKLIAFEIITTLDMYKIN